MIASQGLKGLRDIRLSCCWEFKAKCYADYFSSLIPIIWLFAIYGREM